MKRHGVRQCRDEATAAINVIAQSLVEIHSPHCGVAENYRVLDSNPGLIGPQAIALAIDPLAAQKRLISTIHRVLAYQL